MKKHWILFMCTIIIATMSSTLLYSQEITAANAVKEYFKACQNGDIDRIKSLITGPFYEKRRTLLNDNAGYSNFLIEHFDDVKFSIISESTNDKVRGTIVLVERQYPNAALLRTTFIVVKNTEDTWKIYDEQLVLD